MEVISKKLNFKNNVGEKPYWRFFLFFTTCLIATPILFITSYLFLPYSDSWSHLFDTVLGDYILNSLFLMFGVGFGTLFLGVGGAWLTAMCDFPGRKVFAWAFLLPLAMPAYIIAYTYTGILDFAGPIQTTLRTLFDWNYGDYYFPNIRSLGGAICMLSLVLYPYVYMLTRLALSEQSTAILEASRILGKTPWQSLFSVALPMARPAIVAGVSLALMETLADYGTVEYFGVSTFTTGIFRTWYGLGELTTAAQLCSFLLLFVFFLIILENKSRSKLRFDQNKSIKKISKIRLSNWRAFFAVAFSVSIISLGFFIPAIQLLIWSVNHWQHTLDSEFINLLINSFTLASASGFTCVIFAIFFAYSKRSFQTRSVRTAIGVAGLGYAVPGTVIAIGVLAPIAWFDNKLDYLSRLYFDMPLGLVISGSMTILVFAYLVRFLSISLNTMDSGLSAIKPGIDESARSLGASKKNVLTKVHLPILKTSVLTAFLLVFVEVMKELPTTLILRPFNFNTLAVKTYELASDERLFDAALPALSIVMISLVPILLITKSIISEKTQHG